MSKKKVGSEKTQFKPGQTGNPNGRPIISPEIKALKTLTVKSYREIIQHVIDGNVEQLKEIVRDNTQPALKVAVAAAVITAIKKGDIATVEKILERVIGKVPDIVQFTGQVGNTDLNAPRDKQKLRALIDKLESEV